MSGKTNIQWTDATWSPVVGCTRVSAGCDHCYAFELHDKRHIAWKRGNWPTAPAQYHLPFSRVQLLPTRLEDPLHWRAPRRVFVNSMADLFHKDVPDRFIARIWAVMALTPQHTYQILTKRPERMRAWLTADPSWDVLRAANSLRAERPWLGDIPFSNVARFPLPNVWLGTSVEHQAAADERIPLLMATPAAIRFLSCEPLLGPVNLAPWLFGFSRIPPGYVGISEYGPTHALDWVIVGGESGRRARPFLLSWARTLRDQCRRGEVAFFVKQLGTEWARQQTGRHPHGGAMDQWPEDLQVREWPRQAQKAEVRA